MQKILNINMDGFEHIKLKGDKLIAYINGKIANAKCVLLEELNCKKTVLRKSTDKTLEEILDMVKDSIFIHCTDKNDEVCLIVNHENTDYFIWITSSSCKKDVKHH